MMFWYRVVTVAGGEGATAHLKEHPADLVVPDMIMAPGIDGLETCRRRVNLRPGRKAIIVSGFSESARVKALQRLGAGQSVRKPYPIEKPAETVKQALENGHRLRGWLSLDRVDGNDGHRHH